MSAVNVSLTLTPEMMDRVRESELYKTIKNRPSSAIPFQKCPVCNGTGEVLAKGFRHSVYQKCKACDGKMIIPMFYPAEQLLTETGGK